MSATMKSLFIDANIFLNFYKYSKSDLNALQKVVEGMKKNHFDIIINQHLKDEFYRNRGARIKESIIAFKSINLGEIPTLFKNEELNYKELIKAKKNFEKIHHELLSKIEQLALEENLLADQLINEIFDSVKFNKIDKTIYANAILRMRRKNPPGKPNELGDCLHWEYFIATIKKGVDLIIVSEDGDFQDKLKPRANTFLQKEWTSKKSANLVWFSNLNDFFKEYLPQFQLQDQKKSLIDNLVLSLKNSQSFSETHSILQEVEQYISDFDLGNLNDIVDAYENNEQISWILEDGDVLEFINKIYSHSLSDESIKRRISQILPE